MRTNIIAKSLLSATILLSVFVLGNSNAEPTAVLARDLIKVGEDSNVDVSLGQDKVSPDKQVDVSGNSLVEDDDISNLARENISEQSSDIVLLLDISRSMNRTDPRRLRDQATELLLNFLNTNDRLAVFTFGHDVQQIVPLTRISRLKLPEVMKVINGIPAEGNFTDMNSAIEAAYNELKPSVVDTKVVILLSDGKLDAPPSKGKNEDLARNLLENDLQKFRDKKIKLYTIDFSVEADREFLKQLAYKTGGMDWFADNVNSLHQKFSDLFLTLKRPQIAEFNGKVVDLDAHVDEAIFYINHNGDSAKIHLIDPAGETLALDKTTFGLKWFRGKQFDLVTIKNPLVGRWKVEGINKIDGSFVRIITGLKLQTKLPDGPFKKGDKPFLTARFIQNGKMLMEDDALKDVLFFTYKILTDDGKILAEGDLNDLGEDGDELAKDGVYTTKLALDKAGKYKCLITARAPTFSRQQIILLDIQNTVSNVRLTNIDEQEHFEVRVDNAVVNNSRNLRVVLFAKDAELGKVYPFQLLPEPNNKQIYRVLRRNVISFNDKEALVYAKVLGVTNSGSEINDLSNLLVLKPLRRQVYEQQLTREIETSNNLAGKVNNTSDVEKRANDNIVEEDLVASDTQPVRDVQQNAVVAPVQAEEVVQQESILPNTIDDDATTAINQDVSSISEEDIRLYSVIVMVILATVIFVTGLLGLLFYYLRATKEIGFGNANLTFDFDEFISRYECNPEAKRESTEFEDSIQDLINLVTPLIKVKKQVENLVPVAEEQNEPTDGNGAEGEDDWSLGKENAQNIAMGNVAVNTGAEKTNNDNVVKQD